ncbi:MAG TPA: fused MFS/spermidine synthase [Bryobacteraceae bacterium]|jgi:hypothetical protein
MAALELLYALTVFLSAFLLFQIQPMIAKVILPWFGGVSTVWSTCMLFFQLLLLFGYLYAHWLQTRVAPRRQSTFHIILLVVSLAVLPVAANPAWKPAAGDNPSLRILLLLTATIGLPYFALSATSSLIQAWYARTHHGAVPYRLFALSNAASLLALLTYPLVVEPALTTTLQTRLWSAGYLCFVLVCGSTAWLATRAASTVDSNILDQTNAAPPTFAARMTWIALAACASILLLAVTTFLTQDVAPIPFLWVLPLAVYLLSFIFCFNTPTLYKRWIFTPLLIAALIAVATRLRPEGWRAGVVPTIGIITGSLFVFCMWCHGELVQRKPHPRYLTGFYVMVSVGGAAGGLFVGLIAPNLFNFYYEFPIGLALCAILALALTPVPVAFLQSYWRPALLIAFAAYLAYLGVVVREGIHGYLEVRRSFYGQLRVQSVGKPTDEERYNILIHGRIDHGEQLLADQYRHTPITYFCEESGIGKVMAARAKAAQRVGVIGLGCGTLAAYGRSGDTYRIYEINPVVPQLANTHFSYLKDSPAKIDLILGDGRLSLEREPDQHYDLLVMDAFSGDSVPVHMLTKEAMSTYFRHLKPGGLLAVNATNTFLNLRPVVERAATTFGKIAVVYELQPPDDDLLCYHSIWVILADPSFRETSRALFQQGELIPPNPRFRTWTDDFSSLWGILY